MPRGAAVKLPQTIELRMKAICRSLQFFALVLLPLAMYLEMSGMLGRERGVADMLVLLGFGVAVFGIGWILQSYASR